MHIPYLSVEVNGDGDSDAGKRKKHFEVKIIFLYQSKNMQLSALISKEIRTNRIFSQSILFDFCAKCLSQSDESEQIFIHIQIIVHTFFI